MSASAPVMQYQCTTGPHPYGPVPLCPLHAAQVRSDLKKEYLSGKEAAMPQVACLPVGVLLLVCLCLAQNRCLQAPAHGTT